MKLASDHNKPAMFLVLAGHAIFINFGFGSISFWKITASKYHFGLDFTYDIWAWA